MHLSWLSWLLLTQNFFQVELAEELVETEEELKKELSQEFTRWEFHLFHKVEQGGTKSFLGENLPPKVPDGADKSFTAEP